MYGNNSISFSANVLLSRAVDSDENKNFETRTSECIECAAYLTRLCWIYIP